MTKKPGLYLFFILFFFTPDMFAQSWKFVKESDSVKIYTRNEKGKFFKAYKAVFSINAPLKKIFCLLEDVTNTDWWDKKLSRIKVLHYQKNKSAQYYLVFDLPWPATDRDLFVNVKDTIDIKTGIAKISATPVPGIITENKDLVRIKDYRQIWTIKPTGKNQSLVELEGYVDPAGKIPEWIFNMIIFDIPMNSIRGVRKELGLN